MLTSLVSDLRRAARSLRRAPGLTAAAVVTLAVGIGASTAMFSVVNAVLLHPMGIVEPDRVVIVWPTTNETPGEFSYNAHKALAKSTRALQAIGITGSVNWDARLLLGDASIKVAGTAVSANFFDILGAQPLLGRTFRVEEDRPGARPVLVLSHEAWTTYFGADAAVIGRVVRVREKVDDLPFEVVGVMPAEFFHPKGAMYWTPAAATVARMAAHAGDPVPETLEQLGVFHGLARLAPGVSLDSARADARRAWQAAEVQKVGDASRISLTLTPLLDHVFGRARLMLGILMGAVLIVLLAGCANVSGLLVARGASRAREFAVLAALGASRQRLFGRLFVEGTLLAVLGAAGGVTIAVLFLDQLVALSPADVPRLANVTIDRQVLAFTSVGTVVTAVLLSVFPAWHLNHWSLSRSLQGAAKGSTTGGTRASLRRALVVAQVAIGVVLLVATGLTIRSFGRLSSLDIGFTPANVLTFGLNGLGEARYPDRAQRHDVVDRLIERFGHVPGVQSAAAVLLRPFGAGTIGFDSAVLLEGQARAADDWSRNPVVNFETVTPGYFRAMNIRVTKGRDFSRTDRRDTPAVAIVSENLANRLWPGQDPIGKRLSDSFSASDQRAADTRWLTVVGVVAPVFYREIDRARFDYYVPLRQADFDADHFVVRTTDSALDLTLALGREAAAIDPGLSLSEPTTMDAIVNGLRGPWQFTMLVFVAFGAVAAALTIVGLFGLVSFTVTERRQEVGVRMALGAEARRVVAMFVAEGARLVAVGLGLGVVIAFATTRLLGSLLFDVSPTDLPTFAGAAVLLAVVAILACYVPARRAAAVDPSIVFRDGSA